MSVNHAGRPLISPARLSLSGKILRSILVVRGDDDAWRDSALASTADAVIIDLAACDGDRIAEAHQRVMDFAAQRLARDSTMPRLLIGIHAMGDDKRARADIAALLPLQPDAVVVLAGCGAEIQKLDVMLSVEEVLNGRTPGDTAIVALCGNAQGALTAQSFSGKSARLRALGFDAAALARSLGARRAAGADGHWSDALATSRSFMLLGASAASVAAIDCAPPGILGEALQAACLRSVADGFGAMLTREPAQLAAINAAFGLLPDG